MTIAAAEAARRGGIIRDGDEVVALLTGNGLKTPRRGPVRDRERPAEPGRPGLDARHPGAVLRVRRLAVGMSQVRIPPVLRTSAGGQKLIEVEGATVGEALGALVAAYPDLGPRLLDEAGGINRFVNVFVNETDVRHLQDLATPLGRRIRCCCCRRWRGADLRRGEQRRERLERQRTACR